MHDEDRLAGGESRKPCAGARDLVDETFTAGRPVAGGRFPEFAIGRAEFALEFVVTPSGPGAKILLKLAPLLDLNVRLGEASGAGVAILLARAALACHAGMATFTEAGVSGAED